MELSKFYVKKVKLFIDDKELPFTPADINFEIDAKDAKKVELLNALHLNERGGKDGL